MYRFYRATPKLATTASLLRRAFFTNHLPPQPIEIPPNKMCSLEKTSEHGYELMFATKAGLPIPRFPISHSAVAWHSPTDDHFVVYGRQSPYDPTKWFGKPLFSLKTKMDNEHSYLNTGFSFTAHPTGVFFTKEEMEHCLKAADEKINKQEWCNMINSNCYSYSVTVMAEAIQQQLKKDTFKSEDISKILAVLEKHPLSDHYAVGVFNNETVVKTLREMNDNILTQLDSRENKSDQDNTLLTQCLALKQKIEEEAPKYRIFSVLGA